jgi:predicted secreted protein
MNALDSALRVGGLIQTKDEPISDFEHLNNLVIVDLRDQIQIPDDKEITRWTCLINGTEGRMVATEKPASAWLDIQSEGKVFCAFNYGDEITLKVLANNTPFIWGSFVAKELSFVGAPGYTFLVNNSLIFMHVINVVGKGMCIGAASVQTDAFL